LRALGIPAETALSLATSDLPPLPLGNSASEEAPKTRGARSKRSTHDREVV